MPDLSIITIPHPLGGLSRKTLDERAASILNTITAILSSPPKEQKNSTARKIIVKPDPHTIQIRSNSVTDAVRTANDMFYDYKWTDGLPIVPPSGDAVEWMLAGTDRNPDDIIGIVPPGNGKATVRNIAINAVMAGAKPSYLPVIISSVEAVVDPGFGSGVVAWGCAGMQGTTGPVTPMLIINGPVAAEIGIESGVGCFSRGHRANATIGRAVRLVLTNAGRGHIGINDMKGQGSSQEFTFCVAERIQHDVYKRPDNPWLPLNVERGFDVNTNTVTALPSFPPICVEDAEHCGPEILNAVVDIMASLGQVPYAMDWEYILVLGQTHARCIADAGWAKKDIREFIYANAVLPWSKYKQQYPGVQGLQPGWIARTSGEDTSIHLVASPDNILVMVAGGECPYSQIVRSSYKSVTREIKLPRNWDALVINDSNQGSCESCRTD
jgi:hypothetical protein